MEPVKTRHFTSYEKITETPEQWQLDETGFRQLEKATWVVTEKIHGANFCMLTDGKTITCANRKHILGPQDDFFRYQIVAERFQSNILALFLHAQQRYSEISNIAVYGELCGGGYPHPEVEANPALQPIQTGIYYSPELEFCAFDLALTREERVYLDYAEAIELFQAANLLYAVPLCIGSLQEALNYPMGFQSTLSNLLGLPTLPRDNRAEGIVIKPYYNLLVSSKKGLIRPILKRKIPEFSENKRFSQAQKWPDQHNAYVQELESLENLKWEVFNLATENRLQSAISKLGPVTYAHRSKVQQLFRLVVEDVLEQLEDNHSEQLATLKEHDNTLLHNYIREEVRALFRNVLPGRKY